jgi:DNA invertase Pin-like site-specific DNA recombinase
MLTIEEILATRKNRRAKPTQEDLRKLPYGKAFIYGRVSSPDQVRDSKESVREIAKMVALAKSDGYRSNITAEEIERWLQSIQQGSAVGKIIEDGDIIVDVQDLGISAKGLADEKRDGLAHLRKRLENGETGAVYVTEGVSRLSRDQDRILPFQLLKLFKEQQCRLRTPDGVWNPAIERDWEDLAEEFEDAAKELKVFRKRMHRRIVQKAARGEYVGGPVPAGFILPIIGQKANGKYEFGKYEPYPPHAEIDARIFHEFVRQQGSALRTAQALAEVTFPSFPAELRYMERLSALRMCPRTSSGYRITPDLIRGLVTNLKLIGVWEWGDIEPIPNNHKPAVPEDLFLTAYELAMRQAKPKGRAIYSELLEYSGILWCCNHPYPEPISSHPSEGDYRCQRDYFRGQGQICLDITARFIDEPLTTEVLRQLDFTPYTEEVLVKLEAEAIQEKVEDATRKRQIGELQKRLDNLRGYFGCGDPEREEEYWKQWKQTKAQLDELEARPLPQRKVAAADIQQVRDFLSELPSKWSSYSRTLRNRLLKLLIDRVELRHNRYTIEARIVWRAGLQQMVTIYRPQTKGSRDCRWTKEEEALLRMLWPSSSKEAIQAALPNRSWKSIGCHAHYLKLRRQRSSPQASPQKRWRPEEEAKAKAMYETGVSLGDIVAQLGRNHTAILNKACKQGWHRPSSAKRRKAEVNWITDDLKVLQSESLRHW